MRHSSPETGAGFVSFVSTSGRSVPLMRPLAFIHSLQQNGWAADTQIECQCLMGPALEDLRGPSIEPEEYITKQLKISSTEKRVLILRTSHVGGHKYAGNCIVSLPDVTEQLDGKMTTSFQIYTPQGSCVWYGRVSPHEVDSIVINTIIHGLVLPPLLRGGLNISKPKCKTLNDW